MTTVAHGYYSMNIGGVERNILRTLPRLMEDSDVEHRLILTHPEGPLLDRLPDGLDVLSPRPEHLFSDLYQFYRDADVAHLYTINQNTIHRLPAYLAGTPIIDNPRNIIAIPQANRVKKITCASRAIEAVQGAPGRVKIIPNGLEVEDNHSPSYKPFTKDRPLRLLEIDRADKERTHQAEDFMPALYQRFPEVECHVLGREGEDGQGIVYHGYVEDPRPYYRQSHFLTQFVEAEPFGMTPLEAYRDGVIPVASGEGGIRDLVEHTETGFLMESPNKGEIIQQLKVIIEQYNGNPEFWIPMAENGFELFTEQFTLEAHLDQYRSLYQEVAGAKTPPFPEIEWSSDFNQLFHSVTLGETSTLPVGTDLDNFPESFERDVVRLFILQNRDDLETEIALEFLSNMETETMDDHYEVWLERARRSQQTGDHESALESAQRAIEHEPDLAEPYFIVTESYLQAGSMGSALENLVEYQQEYPDYEPVNNMIERIQELS